MTRRDQVATGGAASPTVLYSIRVRELQAQEHREQLRFSLEDRVAVGVSWPPLRVMTAEYTGRGKVLLTLRTPGGEALHEGIGTSDRGRANQLEYSWTTAESLRRRSRPTG